MRSTAISVPLDSAFRRACRIALACVAGVLLCPLSARAAGPVSRPIVSFAGVADPDNPNSPEAADFEMKILKALRDDRNLQVCDPALLDAQALPGHDGRLRLLNADAPQLAVTAYAHALGDYVLLGSVLRRETGVKVRATLYGTSRGNTVVSWEGTDPSELVRQIDDALGLDAHGTDGAVLLDHLAPVVASADLPLTLNANLRPSAGLTLTAWVRSTGEATWSRVQFSLLRYDLFTASLPAVHEGSMEYYLVATDAQGRTVASEGSANQPHFVQIIGVDTGVAQEPPPPSNHAGAYASFALAAATLAVAIVFTVRAPTAAAERQSCWTSASCEAKSNYLLTNETVMWTAWGATAAEAGIGGLAVHFGW